MIVTLCLNPSFDRTVEVDTMAVGATNRVRTARTDLGGKGVNVARVLERLGVPALCLGMAGRENADRLISLMDAEGLRHSFIQCAGEVRTNTKIISRAGQPLTELNEPGPAPDEAVKAAFLRLLEEQRPQMDCCVLTGSLPGGCKGMYRQMIEQLSGVRCLLDTSGEELMNGLAAHPWLIKPNIDELQAALGVALHSHDEIVGAARRMIGLGAGCVMVSMGGDGALLVTPEEAWLAPVIPVKVGSTVGAGDAMVGGLLYGMERTGSLVEAFRHAVAAATCSVMTEGTQLIRPEDFGPMLSRVTMQKLEVN